MDDDFGIAAGAEDMATSRQLGHQELEVIDLAVEGDTDRPVLVEDRLVAGNEVDDREPAVTEPDPWRAIKAFAIGPAVVKHVGHASKQTVVDTGPSAKIENSGYPAHARAFVRSRSLHGSRTIGERIRATRSVRTAGRLVPG